MGDADRNGPYAWTLMADHIPVRLLRFLAEKDKLTWAQSQAKTIPVEHICPDAQKRLRDIGREEEEQLYSFELTGRERLWGVRSQGSSVYQVLWWDPEHKVCPSNKKHT
jgi:hypothetical protein